MIIMNGKTGLRTIYNVLRILRILNSNYNVESLRIYRAALKLFFQLSFNTFAPIFTVEECKSFSLDKYASKYY